MNDKVKKYLKLESFAPCDQKTTAYIRIHTTEIVITFQQQPSRKIQKI